MTKLQQVKYRFCREHDLAQVLALLKAHDLPYQDISLQKVDFILAVQNDRVIGCIGLEKYDQHGLLRSLVIDKNCQNRGIGSLLLDQLVSYCARCGVQNLHLLTTTAERYFASKGFLSKERQSAPPSIQETTEFSQLCPSSSSYMMKTLAGN